MIRDPSDGSVKPSLPTTQGLQEKYGPNWGLNAIEPRTVSTFKAPTWDELRDHYSKHGLEFKPKHQGEDNDAGSRG
jgi:hypothetical protein